MLTWSNSGDEQGGLSYSVRPAGGDWAAQQQLDGGGEGPLALLADGTALAAFANTTFAPFDGVKVTVRPSGGRFAAPEPVSSAGGWPALAAAGSHAIVVWRQPPYVRLHVAFRERGA